MPPKDKKEKLTSDGVYDIDDWTMGTGDTNVGTVSFTGGTLDNSMDIAYGQMDFGFDENNLRKKYPALKDAWEHYQNIKQMCETREKEEDGS